jgi:hypothetical protein
MVPAHGCPRRPAASLPRLGRVTPGAGAIARGALRSRTPGAGPSGRCPGRTGRSAECRRTAPACCQARRRSHRRNDPAVRRAGQPVVPGAATRQEALVDGLVPRLVDPGARDSGSDLTIRTRGRCCSWSEARTAARRRCPTPWPRPMPIGFRWHGRTWPRPTWAIPVWPPRPKRTATTRPSQRFSTSAPARLVRRPARHRRGTAAGLSVRRAGSWDFYAADALTFMREFLAWAGEGHHPPMGDGAATRERSASAPGTASCGRRSENCPVRERK